MERSIYMNYKKNRLTYRVVIGLLIEKNGSLQGMHKIKLLITVKKLRNSKKDIEHSEW